MKTEIKLTGKGLAAAAAIALGIVIAVASTIARGTGCEPLNAGALVQNIIQEKDRIAPRELAQWIIETRTHFYLTDIRHSSKDDEDHIPTAVDTPLADLFKTAGLARLSRVK